MDIIVAILFYIGVITGPAVYTQMEFDHIVSVNQHHITAIQNDAHQMAAVLALDPPRIIIEPNGGTEE